MAQKSVLLLGSYGQTNLGDDLLMYNYMSWLKSQGFDHIIVNASSSVNIPKVIKQEFPGMEVLLTYQTSLLGWIKTLRRVDCVVYGGGTVFKELYATTGRGKYSVIGRILGFNVLARLLGKPIYNLHIGLGVLKTWLGKTITRLALLTARQTILRDAESHSFARDQLKIPASKLVLANDSLFMNDRWQHPWHAGVPLPKGRYKRVVGLNFLSDIPDWIDRDAYLQAARSFVNDLLKDNNLVVLIPFQHSFNPHNDYVFMQQEILPFVPSSDHLVLVPQLPIDQAVATFKSLDMFVGMRFHSLLLATSAGTPFIGLAYDTKCWRFMREVQYPYAIQLEDVSAQTLTTAYEQLVGELPQTASLLHTIAHQQRMKGQACISKLHL